MKILVMGAGAVGSTIGGMLAQSGHEVTLVGRNPHMFRIAASGLNIKGLWGEFHVTSLRAGTDIPEGDQDFILLTTKAYDTEKAGRILAARFPSGVPVLHLQNGIGNAEILARQLGWDRVLSAMIIIGFRMPLAGHTVVTVSADTIKIGRHDGRIDEPVRRIVEAFRAAKMPVESVLDIQKQLWGKVLYNGALNALASILDVAYGDLLQPSAWAVVERVIGEAFAVLQAEGQPLAWLSPEVYLHHLRTFQVPATFHHKPSMLSDLNHGRRTEIDFINGALADLGRRHRVATPVNDVLVRMIHAFESNGVKGLLHPSRP